MFCTYKYKINNVSFHRLLFEVDEYKWPIVYHDKYNITFMGLEKLHVFDVTKWRNIIQFLLNDNLLTEQCIVKPRPATKEDLLTVHTKKYLKELKWSYNVARITEVPVIALVPNYFVQKFYLKPMRLQTGGSILAGKLALDRGWAINVGGGFHHCSATKGSGFCPYADITLTVRLLQADARINTAMIVDLDAHQGNGYARDFIESPDVYIMDMYNCKIFPRDSYAKTAINRKIELRAYTGDTEYILKLQKHLKSALKDFHPDLLIYNAGTDVLEGDPLGRLSITEHGIIQRDQFVFETCKEMKIPIVMLTSGGYQKITAKIIANSIMNLHRKGIIVK